MYLLVSGKGFIMLLEKRGRLYATRRLCVRFSMTWACIQYDGKNWKPTSIKEVKETIAQLRQQGRRKFSEIVVGNSVPICPQLPFMLLADVGEVSNHV